MTARALLSLLSLYRIVFRPILGARCRFYPTCSDYASEAVSARGAWLGLWMTARRLLRCHPLHPGGYDPVAH